MKKLLTILAILSVTFAFNQKLDLVDLTKEDKQYQTPSHVKLDVPYYFQLSSVVPGQGPRCCFSYSDAMTAQYLNPGCFGNDPDNYLRKVLQYGDTTEVSAQQVALKFYGLNSYFDYNGTVTKLKELVAGGTPVPIGVLHHGPVIAPSGGGHYICIIGYDDEGGYWIVNDPYGEMDVVNGGYVSNEPLSGKGVHYSYKNLNPRWLVDSDSDGWMMVISKP